MVVTDFLAKMSCFITTTKDINASQGTELLMVHVVTKHGIPDEIDFDRDKLFTVKIWARLRGQLRISLRFATSYNPSANSKVEKNERDHD